MESLNDILARVLREAWIAKKKTPQRPDARRARDSDGDRGPDPRKVEAFDGPGLIPAAKRTRATIVVGAMGQPPNVRTFDTAISGASPSIRDAVETDGRAHAELLFNRSPRK